MKKIVLFALLANFISCYYYVNDELPRIRTLKKKIIIDSISFRITGVEGERLKNFSNKIQSRLVNSGIYGRVIPIEGKAQVENSHLEIHLKELGIFEKNYTFTLSTAITFGFVAANVAKQPVLALAGLFIPFYKTEKYSMLVDYYVDGKLKRYDRFNQSVTKLYGPIPAIYAFKNGDSVEDPEMEVISNMTDNATFYMNELNYSEATK
jgi:hypothetical protein